MPSTGERYQLTSGKKSASGAQWSPDSQAPRLHQRPRRQAADLPDLARRRRGRELTAEENGVGAIAWSPDGSAIAFTSSGPDAKASKDRKEKYGDFEIVGGDYTMNHLWLHQGPRRIARRSQETAQGRAAHQGRTFTVGAFSWSPDGKRIAFSAHARSRPGLERHRDALRPRPGRSHVKKLLDAPRAQRQSQMVARRQGRSPTSRPTASSSSTTPTATSP